MRDGAHRVRARDAKSPRRRVVAKRRRQKDVMPSRPPVSESVCIQELNSNARSACVHPMPRCCQSPNIARAATSARARVRALHARNTHMRASAAALLLAASTVAAPAAAAGASAATARTSCGAHSAASCGECGGEAMCHGDCGWCEGACVGKGLCNAPLARVAIAISFACQSSSTLGNLGLAVSTWCDSKEVAEAHFFLNQWDVGATRAALEPSPSAQTPPPRPTPAAAHAHCISPRPDGSQASAAGRCRRSSTSARAAPP